MTAYAPAYPTKRSHSGSVFIILLLLVLASYAAIQVMLGTHAMEKHSDTATLTRDCIQQNGVWKVYQEPKSMTFHWLCKDPSTGTIFDMIVEKISETLYREKTSFLRKDAAANGIRFSIGSPKANRAASGSTLRQSLYSL